MSNEEWAAQLRSRNLSTEGIRYELIQRLARVRYAELGFAWSGPAQGEDMEGLADPGAGSQEQNLDNPTGGLSQPDPFRPRKSRVTHTPKPRQIVPQLEEFPSLPHVPDMSASNIKSWQTIPQKEETMHLPHVPDVPAPNGGSDTPLAPCVFSLSTARPRES